MESKDKEMYDLKHELISAQIKLEKCGQGNGEDERGKPGTADEDCAVGNGNEKSPKELGLSKDSLFSK